MTITSNPTTNGFTDLGLPFALTEALAERSITIPTDVQNVAIPYVSRGANCIVQAKTGTGKTLAFGLPLLSTLQAPEGTLPRVLVVTPTRELTLQVARDLTQIGSRLGLRTVSVYGGVDARTQNDELSRGADIVVGTPGRLLDLAGQRTLRLDRVAHVVLDEADEMLDMGFLPDVTRLMTLTVARTQTLLFSATMPTEIRNLARRFTTNPTYLHVTRPDDDASGAVRQVRQLVYLTHPLDKPEILGKALQARDRGPVIVFCRTKHWTDRLTEDLRERGFPAAGLHGDMSQVARERSLQEFRDGRVDVLVATDVAARGIDIDGVTHVVNYDMPEDAASYLHRIGRTARAGRAGTAVTLVDVVHRSRWNLIASDLGPEQQDPQETFSTSDHLFTDLDIPAGTRGRLTPLRQIPRSRPQVGRDGSRPSRSAPPGGSRRRDPGTGKDENVPRNGTSNPSGPTDNRRRTRTVEQLNTEGRRRRVRRGGSR